MLEQVNNSLTFIAFYTSSGAGATAIAVTADVYDPAGTLIVTGAAATEIGGGLYKYDLASGSVTTAGEYVAIFKTAAVVDDPEIAKVWSVGRAGVESLDAAVSTRSSHAAADVWASTSRTLTGFGTLVADIWSYATRGVTDKLGFKLASDGLDSISTAAPTGTASNFREMLVQTWRRFFVKTVKDRTRQVIQTLGDDGTTVLTEQSYSVTPKSEIVDSA